MDRVRRRATFSIVPIILLIHFAVVVWLSATLNIWVDESYSMNTTSRDLSYAVSQAVRIEEHPPFYFIVLWFWRQVNDSVFWGRMLSALCSLTFLIVAWRVVARALPKIHPAWVIAPIAANPSVILNAVEMRSPAMTMMLSGILMWLFFEGFLIEAPKRWAVVAYGAASVVALYAYYYLGFLLLANGLALLLTRRPRQIVQYYGLMALAAIAYVPMILALPLQTESFTSRMPFSLSIGGGFRLMIERIQSFLWPSFGLPLPGKTRWIIPGLIAATVLTSLYLNRRKLSTPIYVFMAVAAVTAVAFSLVAWQLGWRSMLERHALPIVLPVYLAVFGIISLYGDRTRRKALLAWTTVAGLTCAVGFHHFFNHLAKPGDWKRVAEYIQANEGIDEPILVFPAMSANPFSYHYRGKNEVVAIPRPEAFIRYNHPDDALKSEAEIVDALEQIPYEVDSAWVIVDCNPDYCAELIREHNLDILESFIATSYTVNESRSFVGAQVKYCTRPGRLAASK